MVESRLSVDVLMPVDEQPRSRALNVTNERLEPQVNVVVAVVNVTRRVVSDEDIDRWKRSQQPLDFCLLVEVVASRLVAPRTVEAAEAHATDGVCDKVKVNNRWREWRSAVVVAFDGHDVGTSDCLCHLQDDSVGHVATGDENIYALILDLVLRGFVVG